MSWASYQAALALWQEHGGGVYGPHIDHAKIALDKFWPFLAAFAERAVAAEREECARIAEQFRDPYQKDAYDEGCDATAVAVARAIRARGDKP